jgi:hypothetical protein
VTHLIWPESAFPFFSRKTRCAWQIAQAVARVTVLITGAVGLAEPVTARHRRLQFNLCARSGRLDRLD